jgi:hypothetical protein
MALFAGKKDLLEQTTFKVFLGLTVEVVAVVEEPEKTLFKVNVKVSIT